MRELTYGQAIKEALSEELRRDESVFLLGEDIAIMGGPYRILQGLAGEFGRDRILDTPLAEAGIIGAAVGAALVGMRPVAEIMYIDFSTIAADTIINIAGKIRFMTAGALKVPLVVRTIEGGGVSAGPQHSQCLEMMYVNVPGLIVVLPSNPYDAKGLLKSAIREDNPVIFIEHKALYHKLKGPVPEEEYLVPLGKADIKRDGSDVTVVAISRCVNMALEAADTLAKEGISIEVIDPMTIKPLDEETILNSVRKTGRLVVVHEACKTGGFGAELASVVAENVMDYLNAPIKRVAALDTPIPFGLKAEDYVLPNVNDLLEGIREVARI